VVKFSVIASIPTAVFTLIDVNNTGFSNTNEEDARNK
jgi:hypothetical protein